MAHHKIKADTGLWFPKATKELLWIEGDMDDRGRITNVRVALQENGLPFEGANLLKARTALEQHFRAGCSGC